MGDVFLCLRGEDIGKPKSRRLFRHDVPSALRCFVAGHCGAEVVAAVRGGLLSLEEACERYTLTVEEFLS
ncbi:DUF1153 domain-containing protein, partial [Agrobacterium tumefaciens]|uniref:DUF1153 domain-containing protein n=1 Tax=Agrobacterium tumefaciens TaxID=358 RepID=UPI001574BFAB